VLCRSRWRARTLGPVENQNLKRFVHFASERVTRETVFETDHLWTEVLCLDRNQSLGPAMDEDSDAVFTVLAGEAVFLVDAKRKRLDQWATVLVPAGSEVSVTNASSEPLVLMLVAAPPPVPGAAAD
jgi:mannose-6-phosphate isomerase-like protein (cupin superfamily)